MLERLSDYFYDPAVFWTAPLALAALRAALRGARARWRQRQGRS
jgi:hypothetical protein